MQTLVIRLTSAVIALIIVSILFIFFKQDGLRFLCLMGSVLGARELSRILFTWNNSSFLKALFYVLNLFVFITTAFVPEYSTTALGFAAILYLSLAITYEKKFADLTQLSLFQAKIILAFFYVGLLPALTSRILDLENGLVWFFGFLAIVFSGDTLAYLSGMLWGHKKILPNISPKKTVVGAAGGLAGSFVATLILWFWLKHIPIYLLLPIGLLTGALAQLGDLFESMLKRVANVKDSGRIMPGHGGVLDRIDGLLFGAPVLLLGASILEKFF
jgi:phosphatidate cytidylyltransferase